jgi:hypothetical protein
VLVVEERYIHNVVLVLYVVPPVEGPNVEGRPVVDAGECFGRKQVME